MAAEKNIILLTTGLSGRKPRKILAEFQVAEDENNDSFLPEGHQPKNCSYIKQTESVRISFYCGQCQGCPRQSECNPDIKERTAVMIFSLKSRQKLIESNLIMDGKKRILIGRIRNGVETIPSVIRNKYGVDKMPVRGKLRTKQFFGFKVVALNFTKLIRFMEGKAKCRAFQST